MMEEHKIIYKNGSKQTITGDQYIHLIKNWQKKELVILSGSTQLISAKSINVILPLSEFYQMYPQEHSSQLLDCLSLPNVCSSSSSSEASSLGIFSGLCDSIRSRGGLDKINDRTLSLYHQMQTKIKQKYNKNVFYKA